jgi:hypothetical protein
MEMMIKMTGKLHIYIYVKEIYIRQHISIELHVCDTNL